MYKIDQSMNFKNQWYVNSYILFSIITSGEQRGWYVSWAVHRRLC